MTTNDANARPVLGDFDVSMDVSGRTLNLRQTTMAASGGGGSLGYMAPEVMKGVNIYVFHLFAFVLTLFVF